MNGRNTIRALFLIAGTYDGILGLAFLAVPASIFATFAVPPPNHWGYVQFPAALLIVFALMFFAVGTKPERNRNLIPYGILLKVSYSGVVFGWWMTSGIPGMWKPFAVFDIIFAGLFVWAYRSLGMSTGD
ncbi:MAG TPA: hypothetical protein VLT62_31725 [Candidatus Methylomirabilis sp.]|nr:hypothetical protein [Candidatus Methylomirabilis sp.]HSB80837.1 hypothetical protein [Candidatus Methylomirabilis sp.]